jgi:hypothetical protein
MTIARASKLKEAVVVNQMLPFTEKNPSDGLTKRVLQVFSPARPLMMLDAERKS